MGLVWRSRLSHRPRQLVWDMIRVAVGQRGLGRQADTAVELVCKCLQAKLLGTSAEGPEWSHCDAPGPAECVSGRDEPCLPTAGT